MGRYYRLLAAEDYNFGVAYDAAGSTLFLLPDEGRAEGWMPKVLGLREGGYADYLASELGCRLCSERLKGILEEGASELDVLQWLEVEVTKGEEKRRYYILHFPMPPDVLDGSRTLYAAADVVVKAVLSKDRAEGHRVFGFPKAGMLRTIVSKEVKRAIEAAKCTGLSFSKMPEA